MKKKKIMLIDDHKEYTQELGSALEMSGYEIVISNEASDALDIVEKTRPDLILLDLKMPKKSGIQVACELRDNVELKWIPVIAMSACYQNGDYPLLEVHGIKKCLNKPFRAEEMIIEIESALAALN